LDKILFQLRIIPQFIVGTLIINTLFLRCRRRRHRRKRRIFYWYSPCWSMVL